jgi:hypothetical protein
VPQVPNVPGVPALSSYSSFGLSLLTADLISFVAGLLIGPQWGLFRNGQSVVDADSVVTLEYKQDWALLDYPVAPSGFETYNKVPRPFEARLRFARGGLPADRADFLNSIQAIAGDLNQYDVLTPEVIYRGVNVMHQDYRRTATRGNGLVSVDVWVRQVSVTGTSQFSNTKSPAGANPQGGGNVQTGAPSAQQQTFLNTGQIL